MRMIANRFLVAMHGAPFSGKDTIADALVKEFNLKKLAFATALYREVASTFGVSVDELRSHKWKTEPQPLLNILCSNSYKYRAMLQSRGENMLTPRTSRFHLRNWAHEYRRSLEPNYWIDQLEDEADEVLAGIVVSDLRYVDEYEFLEKYARVTGRTFVVFQITRRSTYQADSHASEAGIPPHWVHRVLENIDGSPEIAVQTASAHLRSLQ